MKLFLLSAIVRSQKVVFVEAFFQLLWSLSNTYKNTLVVFTGCRWNEGDKCLHADIYRQQQG
jgi:hypothetical protein